MKKYLLFILFALGAMTSTNAAAIRYVTPTGAGGKTGVNWANASDNLQLIINTSSPNDEIWVAQGIYKPTLRPNAWAYYTAWVSDGRNNAFTLKSGVAIYGGFVGTETSRAQRNWNTYPTVLSGDLGVASNASDNAYHVVIAGGTLSAATTLDGFTITGGNADGNPETAVNVGGVDYDGTSPDANVTYPTQANGGGLCIIGTAAATTPTFANLKIIGNSTVANGGGIFNTGASPTLTNITITGNNANSGGGIFNTGASPTLTNVTIAGNSANWCGGGIFNTSASPTLTNVAITGNAEGDGGGGGIYSEGSGTITLTNATIAGNFTRWGNGGGIHILNGATTTINVQNSIIFGNTGGDPAVKNVRPGTTGTVIYAYTLLEGGAVNEPAHTIISDASPLFESFEGTDKAGDGDPKTSGTYSLKPCSPAINVGYNTHNVTTTDLAGNPRKTGTIDLGAYEATNTNCVIASNPRYFFVKPYGSGKYGSANHSTNSGETLTLENEHDATLAHSWIDASADLQAVINVAAPGDTIFVAAGTYKPLRSIEDWTWPQPTPSPTTKNNINVSIASISGPNGVVVNRANAFVLKPGVKIYGGWEGAEDANALAHPETRKWADHPTILSGDFNDNDNSWFSNHGEDAYHVVIAVAAGNADDLTTRLDGFTISGGNANGETYTPIGLEVKGPTELANTIGNANGGGIFIVGTFPATTFANLNITLNTTSPKLDMVGGGGGIYKKHGNLQLGAGITLTGNNATEGGGLYSDFGDLTLSSGIRITNNTASFGGGAYFRSFGYHHDTNMYQDAKTLVNFQGIIGADTLRIQPNVKIDHNTAYYQGGGIAAVSTGGGDDLPRESPIVVFMTGGDIHNNTAAAGGGGGFYYSGVELDRSLLRITGGEIHDNSTTGDGGGLHNSKGALYLADASVSIHDNTADRNGGGVYIHSFQTLDLSNGVITHNTAGVDGGGLYLDDGNLNLGAPGILIGGETAEGANHADRNGGGISMKEGTITVQHPEKSDPNPNPNPHPKIQYNTADVNGGGIYASGYGLQFLDDANLTIAHNSATGDGGGIYFTRPVADSLIHVNNLTIFSGNFHINNNTSTNGGGIYFDGKNFLFFSAGQINLNTAANSGGGIYHNRGRLQLHYNSDINYNTATTGNGGGLYYHRDLATDTLSTDSLYIYSTHIHHNTAPAGNGGGIYQANGYISFTGTSQEWIDDKILNNSAVNGGGFYVAGGKLDIGNYTIISNNTATTSGGGIYIAQDTLKVAGAKDYNSGDPIITYNTANLHGGGIYTAATQIDLYRGKIQNNTATTGNGGGIYQEQDTINISYALIGGGAGALNTAVNGGGIYVHTGRLNVTNSDNEMETKISGNTATNDGGGIYLAAGSGMWFADSFIDNNHANNNGGGLYNAATDSERKVQVTRAKIQSNTASVDGGGIYGTPTSDFSVTASKIQGNTATRNGGGIFSNSSANTTFYNDLVSGNVAASGGGIYTDALVHYSNVTVAGNYATTFGGIYVFATNPGQTNIHNTISWGNTSGSGNSNGNANYQYSLIQGFPVTFSPSYNLEGATLPAFNTLNYPGFVDFISDYQAASGTPSLLGNYDLLPSSLSIDRGDVIDYYKDYDINDATRNVGCTVDLGAYEYQYPAPARAEWAGGTNNDWNTRSNWKFYDNTGAEESGSSLSALPTQCTDVYIPGDVTNYPHLSGTPDNNRCNDIYFIQGSELGRQDLLTYQKAHVQLNLKLEGSPQLTTVTTLAGISTDADSTATRLKYSAYKSITDTLARNRWYMLTPALQDAVSGDFAFGDYPRVYMRKFNNLTAGPNSSAIGTWSTSFARQIEPLNPMEGFVVWVNGYAAEYGKEEYGNQGSSYSVSGHDYGLKQQNGILEFPFYNDSLMSDARRIHKLEGNTSKFRYVYKTSGLLADSLDSYTRGANNKAFRLLGETYDGVGSRWTFNANALKYPLTYVAHTAVDTIILIGNPFMATIDFVEFLKDNRDLIQPSFRLYNGVTDQYGVTNVTDLDVVTVTDGGSRYIAPMQGFFVTVKAGVTGNLQFNPTIQALPANRISLKSTSAESNIIRLRATNSAYSAEALVGRQATANDGYVPSEDVYKLFSQNTDVPEIYTIADDYKVVMNFISGASETTVPIGIRSNLQGTVTLALTGMADYAAGRIEFVDITANKVEDISYRERFEYPFDYNADGLLEGRFFLRIQAAPTGIYTPETTNNVRVFETPTGINVLASPDDPIRQVDLYTAGGQRLYSRTNINDWKYTMAFPPVAEQILIVRVTTEQLTHSVKLIKK